MTDLNKNIVWAFTLEDNVSTAAKRMSDAASQADADLDNLEAKQAQTRDSVDRTEQKLQSQQLTVVTQLTALMGFREAVSAVTGGIIGLGIVSDETAVNLNKINAAFSIFAGAVSTIKAVQAVMTTLNGATALNAVLNSFNAVLQSPAKLAVVGLAAGAAVGAAGAFLMTNNTTNNSSTTINVANTTPTQARSEIFQVVGGGAL